MDIYIHTYVHTYIHIYVILLLDKNAYVFNTNCVFSFQYTLRIFISIHIAYIPLSHLLQKCGPAPAKKTAAAAKKTGWMGGWFKSKVTKGRVLCSE